MPRAAGVPISCKSLPPTPSGPRRAVGGSRRDCTSWTGVNRVRHAERWSTGSNSRRDRGASIVAREKVGFLRVSISRVALVSAVLVVLGAPRARGAEPWGRAFAAESDTTIFALSEGPLLKAPFHLASRETLWLPRGERLVR